jgi:UDP-glucuronate decarboxylase
MLLLDTKIVKDDYEYLWSSVGSPEKIKDSVFLITGVAGFLGCNYVNSLCSFSDLYGQRPKSVIGLDNFILRRPDWLAELSRRYGFLKIYDFDIVDGSLSDVPGSEEADYIVHLASIASPSFYRKFPLETLEANVWGLKNLLEFFKDRSLRSFLFFSSSEIYGDPLPEFIPTSEDYFGNVATIGPRACYDEAKRFGETLCYVFSRKYDLPVKVVRPFNNYGPGMPVDDKRVVADFAGSILSNRDIVIHSDGSPTRTFCYISDALIGYFKALYHDGFDAFNIGIDHPEISIKQLAGIYSEIGKEHHGYTGRVIFETSDDREYLTDNPNRRCPDIEKARKILAYQPRVTVKEGVWRFLEFLKEMEG